MNGARHDLRAQNHLRVVCDLAGRGADPGSAAGAAISAGALCDAIQAAMEGFLMSAKPAVKVGRLALRHEGRNWNAYYAMPDTMEGAIPLGSIAMRFVEGKPDRMESFIGLMREAVSDLIEELTGILPTWPEGIQPAPEHERAGHA
jgi:hypothetical protein